MSDDRPAAYEEGDKVIYRASAVGLCDEALVAIRMGITPAMPPGWFQEKLDEGTGAEAEIIQLGADHSDLVIKNMQDEVQYPITSRVAIRGHTDGSGIDKYGPVGVEAKKLGPTLFKNWDKGLDHFWATSPYYRDQLTIYMEGTGLPFWYFVGEWDPEAKEVKAVHVRRISEPPGDITTIKKKLLRVEARARKGDMGSCDGSKSWPCPVYFLHEEKERAEVDGENQGKLEALARAYHDAQQQEANGKKIKGEVKKELLEFLTEHGYVTPSDDDTVKGDVDEPEVINGCKVTPYFHKATGRPDIQAMKDAGIDVDHYRKPDRYTPAVRVTVAEEDE